MSRDTEDLGSTSVVVVDIESVVSSRSTPWIDGALDGTREDEALGPCEVWGLSVIIWTRRSTSRHSASSCSPEYNGENQLCQMKK